MKNFLLIMIAMTITSHVIAQHKLQVGELEKAMASVGAGVVEKDIRFLSDDVLLGRSPGSTGFKLALDYCIGRLKESGAVAAGEKGGWLQKVRLRRAFVKNVAFSGKDKLGEFVALPESAYVIYPNPSRDNVHVSSSLVFAGFGISEPKLGYDDYQNIDVKGKTVVIMRGSPRQFSSSAAAHVSNISTILKTAAAKGAIGVIVASADTSIKALPDVSNGVISVLDERGNVAVSRSYVSDKMKFYGVVNVALFNTWVNKSGKDAKGLLAELLAGKPSSFELRETISLDYQSYYQESISYNLIAKITGSDPLLKKEFIVHSAHLDHLGIGKPIEGDSIYNGAHDNASGVASVLAISKMYASLPVKQKRSILFVLLTGEELGLLGSGYFAAHPTVSAKKIIANVNTDMPTIIAPLLSVTALGAEHSTLSSKVEQSAKLLNLAVEADPEPKQARFTRSDQYSFVLAGIPSLHIKYGSATPDGKNNLNEKVAVWRAKYYHKPQDDINGVFDFNAGVTYAKLNFLIGLLISEDRVRPIWNRGDVFEIR